MTVTLEPELERELSQKAAAQGQDAEAYLHPLIQTALCQSVPPIIRSTLSLEDFQRLHEERIRLLSRETCQFLPLTSGVKTFMTMRGAKCLIWSIYAV